MSGLDVEAGYCRCGCGTWVGFWEKNDRHLGRIKGEPKLPGCLRVIHFESAQPSADPGLKKNARGRYKTRVDREFCKYRGCKQKYHYRRKAGWSGYD